MYQARKKTFLFHSIKRHFTSTITALTNLQTSTNTNAKTKLIPNGIANIKAKPNTKNPSSTKNTIGNAKFIEHIQRFCKEGRLNQAVGILKDMDRQGVRAEVSAYASLLQCCLETKSVAQGRKVHNHMIENGFSLDLFLGTKLVVMYAKCGSLEEARKVFDEMHKRTAVSWTAMIAGYAKGKSQEALELFNEMQRTGVVPDKFTFASVLPACARLGSLEYGKKVHREIKSRGFEDNLFVGSGLVDMYVKCGSVKDARIVFNKMSERNVVSWTAMVAGYAQNGQVVMARKLFDKMPERNVVSWNAMLGGYAEHGMVDEAEKLFEQMAERNTASWNGMISAYLGSGNVEKALEFFEKMPDRDIITWNTMISAFTQNWCFIEALDIYKQMKQAGVKPNSTTFSSVLPACANSAAIEQGKEIHIDVRRSGLEPSVFVGSALVDMHAKCGRIEDARKVFEKMPDRNVVLWTAMIGGYALNGCGKEALQIFKAMRESGTKPNHITFAGVLAACCHAGLVDEGREYFDSMSRDHNITPELRHFCHMVDLLGRAGRLNEANEFIKKMPVQPDADIWVSLLRACIVHNKIKLGKHVAERLLKNDPNNFSHYVMISNMYAAAGRMVEKEKVRELMRENQVKKMPGRSWIEINKKLHSFCTGDKIQSEMPEILSEAQQPSGQIKEVGYELKTNSVVHDDDDKGGKDILYHHSAKLAIAYGLLNTPRGMPIRIAKNVRVCDDCHSATKIISKIFERQIFVRDAKRVHYFKDGQCSCGDYW
ncbi:pentatricopeptide repeat-containing protein At1g09410, mitochondrial [Cryptomeria japonica]|uniref:pentatricopeptide repeat-containing protein At1g09410, mitochondrial n=1 Tax=Cryptomeria japonica TaxID=3369 RepID=UPI0027DA70A4|nr:pentatricopeptide repeat-containing protein At1g09410, mitochondrial [Cryptomeria japonica]